MLTSRLMLTSPNHCQTVKHSHFCYILIPGALIVLALFFLDMGHGPRDAVYHLYGFAHVIFFHAGSHRSNQAAFLDQAAFFTSVFSNNDLRVCGRRSH